MGVRRYVVMPLFIFIPLLIYIASCGEGTPGSQGDTDPPFIESISPTDGYSSFGVNDNITIVFSEAMDTASAESAFSLKDESGNPIQGGFIWNGNSMIFDPDISLEFGETYYIKILVSAKDLAGNQLADEHSSHFITESQPSANKWDSMIWDNDKWG